MVDVNDFLACARKIEQMNEKAVTIAEIFEKYLKSTNQELNRFRDITKFLYGKKNGELSRNGHSLDCYWCDPEGEGGPATCNCLQQSSPLWVIRKLLTEYGTEYIIWTSTSKLWYERKTHRMNEKAAIVAEILERYLKSTNQDLNLFRDTTKFLFGKMNNEIDRNCHSIECYWRATERLHEFVHDLCQCCPYWVIRKLLMEYGADYLIWANTTNRTVTEGVVEE
jgi:hypothetical protein